jgi:hypothetical protein
MHQQYRRAKMTQVQDPKVTRVSDETERLAASWRTHSTDNYPTIKIPA